MLEFFEYVVLNMNDLCILRSEHSAFGGRDTSSEYSLSSMSAQSTGDECFRSPCHSEASMARMETYFQLGQLTDVTLIAGKLNICVHNCFLH